MKLRLLSFTLGLILVGSGVLQADDATLMSAKATASASGNKTQSQQQGQSATTHEEKMKKLRERGPGDITILPSGVKN